jgi:hypothetical protein
MNQPADSKDVVPFEARLVDTPDQQPKFVQSRQAVLAILFLMTGFLGIPLLWLNKKFSNAERIFWSIVVTLYTLVLIWLAYRIVMWSYHEIMRAL